jgi:hypothetical protein
VGALGRLSSGPGERGTGHGGEGVGLRVWARGGRGRLRLGGRGSGGRAVGYGRQGSRLGLGLRAAGSTVRALETVTPETVTPLTPRGRRRMRRLRPAKRPERERKRDVTSIICLSVCLTFWRLALCR